ncbi:MAG TPA: DMT family transporter [Casimicrobiaceae bacterium]
MTSNRALGIALVVGSAVAFGAMAIFARFAYASGVDTPSLLALRFALAGIVLAALARARGVALPRGRDLVILIGMGAVGYASQSLAFFAALTYAPAGVVALLLYLYPALVAVLGAVFLHEHLTRNRVAALVVALAGMVLTVAPALAAASSARPLGIALAIASAVIYSIYIVVGTRVAARVSPDATSATVCMSAAAVYLVAALARGVHWPQSVAGWGAVAAIALVSTVIAITLFFAGLARVGATRAATLSTVEPVVTVILAALVLDERIAPIQVAGGVLILAAVWMLARAPESARRLTVDESHGPAVDEPRARMMSVKRP